MSCASLYSAIVGYIQSTCTQLSYVVVTAALHSCLTQLALPCCWSLHFLAQLRVLCLQLLTGVCVGACSCWTWATTCCCSTTTRRASRCWSTWCAASGTASTPTARSSTTSTSCSCSPAAPRARTSTPRSSVTRSCRSTTSSASSHIRTAFPR